MRRMSASLALLAALSGCAMPLGADLAGNLPTKPKADKADAKAKADPVKDAETPVAPAGDTTPAAVTPAGPTTTLAQPEPPPKDTLGGLKFEVLAPENARYAGGVGGAMPAPSSAPMAAPMPGMTKGGYYDGRPAVPVGLTSGNMNGGYYGYGYGPGYGGEPTTLVSLTQSVAPGSKAPYQEMMAAIVQPVIKDWAADAKLLGVNAMTGSDGQLIPASPAPSDLPPGCENMYGGYEESGWRLSYQSKSRNEMLNFYVTPAKTVVVRARWAPLDLGAVDAKVGNDAALRALIAAIETPGFKGEEEKTGLDYFMGGAFGQTCAVPAPMPMPIAPDGYAPNPDDYRTEVVFDVPEGARWSTNLQVILGKPVWELHFYHYEEMRRPVAAKPAPNGEPMPEVYEDPGFHLNNSGHGLVDAATGAVIRFSRPSKQYYPKPTYQDPYYGGPYASPYPGGPYPTPMPSAAPPTSPPSPAPSVTPAVGHPRRGMTSGATAA